MFAGLKSLLRISASVNPPWWGLSQAACSACFLDMPHLAAPFQLWTGPTLFYFGLAIFLSLNFFGNAASVMALSLGRWKSFPHLMDVLPGLIPGCQELEATCLCPLSSWRWRDPFHSSAYSFAYSHVWICQQCLCISQPFALYQLWEGQHRLSVTSIPFQSII